ncbi:hypothetical protein GJB62_35120 (plasmid) [Nostoc sp. ATCC 53789]|nr:hypothetical protein GJB62_35120 [Nostoc sp. ATCC 53789]
MLCVSLTPVSSNSTFPTTLLKIGLTRNLEARLDTLHSNQACTDLEEVYIA